MPCSHCDSELFTESEQRRGVCNSCRKFGLINGRWPMRGKEVPATPGEDKKADPTDQQG